MKRCLLSISMLLVSPKSKKLLQKILNLPEPKMIILACLIGLTLAISRKNVPTITTLNKDLSTVTMSEKTD